MALEAGATSMIDTTDTSTLTDSNTPGIQETISVDKSTSETEATVDSNKDQDATDFQFTKVKELVKKKRKEAPTSSSLTLSQLKNAQKRSMRAIRGVAKNEMDVLEPNLTEESRDEIAGILQAHVNEVCSSTFTHLARHYFPKELQSTKKDENPIDPQLLERIKQLEAQIKATESNIQTHQTRLPATIREILSSNFSLKAKPLENVVATTPAVAESPTDVAMTYSSAEIEDLKATFAKISSKIEQLDRKLPVTKQATSDTIQVIQHAMSQPKSHIDTLMEHDLPPSKSSPGNLLRTKLAQLL